MCISAKLKPNSSIFGSLPNNSICYSVANQIYLVDIWSTIWLLFGLHFVENSVHVGIILYVNLIIFHCIVICILVASLTSLLLSRGLGCRLKLFCAIFDQIFS